VNLRIWKIPLWLVLLAVFLTAGLRPASADERILSFISDVRVHRDASLTVTETIKVRAERRSIKRGIVRDFPTTYRNRFGGAVRVGFEVEEVRRDGRVEPFRIKSTSGGKKIYIGQKQVFLRPGIYTYTIRYRTDRQVGFFKDFDELYWNATGTGWTFPIDYARAVIDLPPGAEIRQTAAYTGPFGAKGRDYRVSRESQNRVVFTTTRPLGVKEGLTVAVAWAKGLVMEPTREEKVAHFLRDNMSALVGLLWVLLTLGYYLVAWVQVGRDPASGVIIPLFTPPEGFSPAGVRYLWRLGFDDKTFTTEIVDLAVRGHVRIEEADGEYSLRDLNPAPAPQTPTETRLLSRLFAGDKVFPLKNEHHQQISDARETLKKSLQKALLRVYFRKNSKYLIPGVVLTLVGLGAMVLTAPQVGQAAFSVLWLSIWTVACCYLVTWAWKKWQGTGAPGFRRWGKIFAALVASLLALAFLGGEAFGLFFLGQAISLGASVLLVVLIVLNGLFFYLLKAPTLKGRKIMDQIDGFRLYLSVAEQERMNMLNPPDKNPELFEKYLPYALSLDVEVEWCEQFADVLAHAGVGGQSYSPSWYVGHSWNRMAFSDLGSSLGDSFAGAMTSAASPPGSSVGSGGGGFSGGGGGGGGGSGW